MLSCKEAMSPQARFLLDTLDKEGGQRLLLLASGGAGERRTDEVTQTAVMKDVKQGQKLAGH